MLSPDFHAFIFSFNRGVFLQNLLLSIHRLMPWLPVTIIDDHSTDVFTLRVLESASCHGVTVLKTPYSRLIDDKGRHGRLYTAMQFVVDEVASSGTLALFLQEDMQVIRRVSRDESHSLRQIVMNREISPFFYVNFLKTSNDPREIEIKNGLYHWRDGRYKFADVCCVNIDQLRSSNWRFDSTEEKCSDKAVKLFNDMLMTPYPFTAFLPWPESYYHRVKPLSQRLWEQRFAGFFPYIPMSDEDNVNFLGRDIEKEIPYSDLYLHTLRETPLKPWRFNGFKAAPRLIRMIAEMEKRLLPKIS